MLLRFPSRLFFDHVLCSARLTSARVGLARKVRIGPQTEEVKARIQRGGRERREEQSVKCCD